MDNNVPEFMEEIRAALDSADPLDFLVFASTLVAATQMAPKFDIDGNGPEADLNVVIDSLLTNAGTETDALLMVWAEMLDNAELANQVNSIVKPRVQVLPGWITMIDSIRPTKIVAFEDLFQDNQTIVIQSEGRRASFLLLIAIDLMGAPYIEDASVSVDSLEDFLQKAKEVLPSSTKVIELSLADAKARLEETLEMSDHMWPPLETETWPSVRALLEWQMRLLPEGGSPLERTEWTEEQFGQFFEAFLASSVASGLRKGEEWLAHALIDFACNYGSGDPRAWSSRLIERTLFDLAPRKLMTSKKDLLAVPKVLSALIAFSHQEMGVDPKITADVQSDLKAMTPDYRRQIKGSGRSGGASPLEQIDIAPDMLTQIIEGQGFEGFEDSPEPTLNESDSDLLMLFLASQVGGLDNLQNLDDTPLPNEPLSLENVENDIQSHVQEIGEIVTQISDGFFQDQELRTASLRTLNFIACASPEIFRRKSRNENTAAAICWIAGHNNAWFAQTNPKRTVTAMIKWLGIKTSPSQRAQTMLYALQSAGYFINGTDLGDARLLSSQNRRAIIEARDLLEH